MTERDVLATVLIVVGLVAVAVGLCEVFGWGWMVLVCGAVLFVFGLALGVDSAFTVEAEDEGRRR